MARLQNPTQNQHFISQSEQRLNAINPHAAERRSRRIFAFNLADRKKTIVTLDQDQGVPLRENLAFSDLFSLDIQGKLRLNLEDCFQRYERDVATHTKSLLAKLNTDNPDIKVELIGLFMSKFLNLLRNPHSVTKVLNLLGDGLGRFAPTEPQLLQAYRELASPKPYQEPILRAFKLTSEDYRRWLQSLFLMVAVDLEGRPILDHIVRSILQSSIGHITVHRYSESDPDALCLLSDRGLNDLSSSDKTRTMIMWDFNLTSKAFIRLGLSNLKEWIPINFPHLALEERRQLQQAIQGNISFEVRDNDLKTLTNYNVNAVLQCAQQVFCAGRSPYGVHVARKTRSGAWRTCNPSQRSRTRALALAAISRKVA